MPVAGHDYWKVNSYGYPNPFSQEQNAQQAWETFLSFFRGSSYSGLKAYWASSSAPRNIDPHAVESWKATFEEFGLLYVLRGSDQIRITPAGEQFRNAADKGQKDEFAWIGLSLLLRYPLRGTRGRRGAAHEQADILLYWFLYAAMRDLQGYFWWSELERVLCSVFTINQAAAALDTVIKLRSGTLSIDDLSLPTSDTHGAFYNSLNQVVVHASLNYLLLGKSADDSLYTAELQERKHWIIPDWTPMIDMALGGRVATADCDGVSSFVARMPKAPDFGADEEAYFDYAGALVGSMPGASSAAGLSYVSLPGGSVPILRIGSQYVISAQSPNHIRIVGPINVLCKLAKGQGCTDVLDCQGVDARYQWLGDELGLRGKRDKYPSIRCANCPAAAR